MNTATAETAADPKIRWLKLVVIGLGVVFLGLAVLLVVLILTGGPKRQGPVTGPLAASEAAMADRVLTLPKNSRVTDVLSSGSRIVVRVRLADGTERLYALDADNLRPLGSMTLQPER